MCELIFGIIAMHKASLDARYASLYWIALPYVIGEPSHEQPGCPQK